MAAPRLTIIGLDAATWDVIDPLVEAGDLPNLARLASEGTSGTLHSTIHPLTPHAWSTMVTGVNAGRPSKPLVYVTRTGGNLPSTSTKYSSKLAKPCLFVVQMRYCPDG